jgi:hypothetical protein
MSYSDHDENRSPNYANGREAARVVSKCLNSYGNSESVKGFLAEMERDHRSLQQSFTTLCVAWLQNLAAREHFDLRNEDSVKLARAVKPILDQHPLRFI